MISLQNVRFVRNERTIIDHISLEMKKGEHWVLLGRNGSGKTTLLELINGYVFPTSGTVSVLGHRYGSVDLRDIRREIGYMSQSLLDKFVLRDPVWEIVASGKYAWLRVYQKMPREVVDQALDILTDLNISHLRNQPLGTLSQGERKKVLLARSLMQNPKLLIMDEPCSGLDLYEREKFLEDIQNLEGRDLQMIYVTHHSEEIVPVFTHAALIHEGRLIAAGPKEEILTGKNMSRLFSLKVEVDWDKGRPWLKV